MEREHHFGVCPSGLLNVRYLLGICLSLKCPLLSFFLSPSCPRPPFLPISAGGWGLAAALPVGVYPASVLDPGKRLERVGGQAGGWSPRGQVLLFSSTSGLQAASPGWSVHMAHGSPSSTSVGGRPALRCFASLRSHLQFASQGEIPIPYFTSLRGRKHHPVAKGPALSTHVLVACLAARPWPSYLPPRPQPYPPPPEEGCHGTCL